MPKYELKPTEKSIIWPAKCVVCGENTTGTGISECHVTKNIKYKFLWWEHNYASLSIKYPICDRDKYLYWFPSYFSKRSLFNLGLSIISIFIVTVYVARIAINIFRVTDINSDNNTLFMLLSFGISICLIYYLSRLFIKLTPVKILSFDGENIVIFINSNKYAQGFEKANSTILVKSNRA